MVASGAADVAYVRTTTPRSWSGFGAHQMLSTCRQARMTVQFLHNGAPSASLAVWMYLVPNATMRCPILLGRDSWMRFRSRSYRTLPHTSDGRVFGELTLAHINDDSDSGASAYIRNRDDLEVAYHLTYEGDDMSLDETPHLLPVNLVRCDGSSALTGHYMVDLVPLSDNSDTTECFVASGRQNIPLSGCRELKTGDILGTACSPLLSLSLIHI